MTARDKGHLEEIIKHLKRVENDYNLDLTSEMEWLRGVVKEEPVSEDLEKACEQLAEKARKHKAETISPFFSPTDYEQGVIDGANWKEQQMMAKAIEVEVKIDAGGYPYIPQIELYDYDNEVPLAKAGDKVKVKIFKED